MSISETEAKMINEYSKNIDMQDIGLFWQLTIKTIDDLKTVGNENLTLEMYIMQLVHLNSLDQREGVVEESDLIGNSQEILTDKSSTEISKEKEIQNKVKKQLKSTNQVKSNPIENIKNQEINSKIEISSFQDLIDQSNKEKEIELKFDLERNVKLVSFNKGKIDISFNEKLNKNFIKNLSEKLLKWTGERWIISLSKNSEVKSIYEKALESKNVEISEFKKSKIAKDIETNFPDAKLIEIINKEE